ncbi:DUF2188 domain-containing protein [Pseudomonas typographi]|uniref:DUF2188 domain-containing protein n=1 Tax=Pseudomonas typographi TaxID=2715964 RepID=A0ABR7YWK7_9PSED|nr:DUF2188 domain-containing protein [Pseudomonas typographi]MBD1597592.1 DUF2188 domain-containing protein [Pseudomonas typographi]
MDSYHVTHADNHWVLKKAGTAAVILQAPTKDALVQQLHTHFAKTPVSVRIHKLDGTIEEERTYPRSADPRGSKG